MGRLAAGAAAGASGRGTEGAVVGVAVGGLVAFAEGVEFVGEGDHEVAGEVVVALVVDVVGGDRAGDVAALLQEVVGLEGEGEGAAAEEFVGYGGVPHPFVLVVAGGVAAGGGVGQVGAENEAYGSVVVGGECAAIVMDCHVAGALQRVGGVLQGVAGAQLEFEVFGAKGD